MMRNDDIDELDLSRHRSSRLPGILVIGAAIGVALIAAWVFMPLLMSKDSAPTANLLPASNPRPAAQAVPALASAEAVPAADASTAADDAAAPQTAAAAFPPAPETTASTPWNNAPAWPQSRSIQVAAAPAAAVLPPAEGDARFAAATPQDTPTEPVENVPLPRRRPSRLIAASLVIPLPRPRPEIETEAPAPAGPTTFDLQVERMR